MSDWTFWDHLFWWTAFVILPIGGFIVGQWRSHRQYREMRRRIERIGKHDA